MALKCFNCDKGVMIGKQHKHHPGVAGGRWKRRAPKTRKVFRPNLHVAHILLEGNRKKVKLCTKCLRLAKQAMREATAPKQILPQQPLAAIA